jgi:hypothetical protein
MRMVRKLETPSPRPDNISLPRWGAAAGAWHSHPHTATLTKGLAKQKPRESGPSSLIHPHPISQAIQPHLSSGHTHTHTHTL